MEADNKKNIIVFIGNVSAVQGDMEIKTDRLEVYMKKKAGKGAAKKKAPAQPGEGSVERLIARGNVLITQGKLKFASGNLLDYNERTGIAILTGNPRAWENNNQVVGTKIKLFLREGKTVVYGGKKRRVSVTLFPEGGQSNRPGAGRRGR
jgi:lipopolysaccharide export system protein LptA